MMDPVDTTFGSDQHGLVWGYRFSEGEPPRPISCDGALDGLDESGDGRRGGFVWLHFSSSNAAAERWLKQHLALPESFHAALHEAVGATRVEQDGDSLVAVLHDVLFEFRYDAADVSTVCLCVQPRILISARPRPLRSIDRLRAAVKGGAELSGLRRTLVRLQRLLAPEPAALFRLLSRPPIWMSEADVQNLRESAEEFATAVADSGALVERIKLLQEELAAIVNEQSNRISSC